VCTEIFDTHYSLKFGLQSTAITGEATTEQSDGTYVEVTLIDMCNKKTKECTSYFSADYDVDLYKMGSPADNNRLSIYLLCNKMGTARTAVVLLNGGIYLTKNAFFSLYICCNLDAASIDKTL
jgi:hypothetical protein